MGKYVLGRIRQANTVTNLPPLLLDNQALNEKLMGESHFQVGLLLPSVITSTVVCRWIENPADWVEDYEAARNTFEECVNFIIDLINLFSTT
jgi:hypothetical protein